MRSGLSLPAACSEIDLSPDTVKGWLARGRREAEGDYRDFADQIEAARTAAHASPLGQDDLVALLEQAARRGSVRAISLLLQRVDRQEDRRGPYRGDDAGEWAAIYGESNGSRRFANPLDELDAGGAGD